MRTYYGVEKQLTAQPTKCWVVRIAFGTDGKKIFTPLFGPFLGAKGEVAAKMVADDLSAHHTDEWDQLASWDKPWKTAADEAKSVGGQQMTDMINHPPHYTAHESGIECIEATRWMSADCANAFKYVWRAGLKGDAKQCLEKALWYVRDAIDNGTEQPGPVARAKLLALDWEKIRDGFDVQRGGILYALARADIGQPSRRAEYLTTANVSLEGIISLLTVP